MDPTFAASTSGKSATGRGKTTTPFDQIAELERREEKRTKQEIEGMEREKHEVEVAVAQKEEQAEHAMKEKAKQELKEYGEAELGKILREKEDEGAEQCDTLEARYKELEAEVVKNLVQTMIDINSPLFSKS